VGYTYNIRSGDGPDQHLEGLHFVVRYIYWGRNGTNRPMEGNSMKIGDLVTLKGSVAVLGLIVSLSENWVKVSWKVPGISHIQTHEKLVVVA